MSVATTAKLRQLQWQILIYLKVTTEEKAKIDKNSLARPRYTPYNYTSKKNEGNTKKDIKPKTQVETEWSKRKEKSQRCLSDRYTNKEHNSGTKDREKKWFSHNSQNSISRNRNKTSSALNGLDVTEEQL